MRKPFPACAVCLLGTALLTLALEAGLAQPGDEANAGSLSNLARGKPCQVFSSHEEQGWSAAKLTDGETSPLGWSSKAFAAYADHALYPEFVGVDLETNSALRRVLLYPRSDGTNAGKGFPVDFTIQVCREGEPWRVAVEKRDYSAPQDGAAQRFELPGTEGRYVKVEATRLRAVEPGTHRFQLAEIAVLGETTALPPLADPPATREGPTTVGACAARTATIRWGLTRPHRDSPGGCNPPHAANNRRLPDLRGLKRGATPARRWRPLGERQGSKRSFDRRGVCRPATTVGPGLLVEGEAVDLGRETNRLE